VFVYVVVVQEVAVVAMNHRLVSVTGEVFVVGGFGVLVGCHRSPLRWGPTKRATRATLSITIIIVNKVSGRPGRGSPHPPG